MAMAPSKSIFLPLLTAIPHVTAWGNLGHTTVAFIAQNFVASKTAEFAKNLLGDSSDAYLANVATWADTYRSTAEGKFSSGYHYIDALDNPPQSCNVIYERDCPEDGCIVSALANYTVRAVQADIDLVEQQKALKWVIHFIGDIHQPLHVENLAVGGNSINVKFNGENTNLHSIWDTAIPQKIFGGNYSISNAQTWATNLTAEINTGIYQEDVKCWRSGINVNQPINSTMVWAVDTNQFVCSTVIPNGVDAVSSKELSGTYYESAAPVVREQLAKAGVRLAAWLDAMVDNVNTTVVSARYAGKIVNNRLKREVESEKAEFEKRKFELEPWMMEARAKRAALGGCGCAEEEHEQ